MFKSAGTRPKLPLGCQSEYKLYSTFVETFGTGYKKEGFRLF